jgi:hypothetical protein
VYDTTLAAAGETRRPFSGSTDEIMDDIATYAGLGVSELIFDFRSERLPESIERMERFAATVMRAGSPGR